MNRIEVKGAISAEYSLRITSESGAVREIPFFKNAIVNNGMNVLAAGSTAPVSRACVGAGSTPVTNADTALASFIRNDSTIFGSTNYTKNATVIPLYVEGVFTYRFPAAVAAYNVSEVGLQTSGASPGVNGNLFSRALVKDALGNPITISVQVGEILDVIYRYRIYVANDGNDITGTMVWTIDGIPTNYDYTLRAAAINANFLWQFPLTSIASFRPDNSGTQDQGYAGNGTLGAVTATGMNPGAVGTFSVWNAVSFVPYVADSFYLDCTFTVNPGVVTGATFSLFYFKFNPGQNGPGYQLKLTTPLPAKGALKRTQFQFRITWSRAP